MTFRYKFMQRIPSSPDSACLRPAGPVETGFLPPGTRRMILHDMNVRYRHLCPISHSRLGFTLIELLVVLAIIATLLVIAAPRYFRSVDHSREVALKQSLAVMRDAIDKFHGDQGVYPEALETLVEKRYLRSIPVDPITESATTWQITGPPEQSGKSTEKEQGKVYDVKSGAEGRAADGTEYKEW